MGVHLVARIHQLLKAFGAENIPSKETPSSSFFNPIKRSKEEDWREAAVAPLKHDRSRVASSVASWSAFSSVHSIDAFVSSSQLGHSIRSKHRPLIFGVNNKKFKLFLLQQRNSQIKTLLTYFNCCLNQTSSTYYKNVLIGVKRPTTLFKIRARIKLSSNELGTNQPTLLKCLSLK